MMDAQLQPQASQLQQRLQNEEQGVLLTASTGGAVARTALAVGPCVRLHLLVTKWAGAAAAALWNIIGAG